MEPTSEVSSFHSMKLRGDWGSGCIVDHRYHTANLLRQLITGIQVPDNASIVKEAFSSILEIFGGFFSKILLFLSDQAMYLFFLNKPAKYSRFSVLGCTFQGQKHGCKDVGLRFRLPAWYFELRQDKTTQQASLRFQLRPNKLGFFKLISF